MACRLSFSFTIMGSPLTAGNLLSVTIFTTRPSFALASSFLTLLYLDESKNTSGLLEWDQVNRLRGGIGEVCDRLSLFGEVGILDRAFGDLIVRTRGDGYHRQTE